MKREVKIGIFAVVILLCSWAGIRFLSGLDVFSSNKVYYAFYESVSGVQNASPVMIRGVKVGQVSAITLDPTKEAGVQLALTVSRKYSIPSDSHAKVVSNGLLGSKAVEIIYGSSSDYLSSGDEIGTMVDKDLMSAAGDELEELKKKITKVVENLTETLGKVGSLVETNHRSINGIMTHLDSMTGSMNEVITGGKRDLKDIVENLAKFSEALGRNDGKIDSLMLSLNTVAGQLASADIAQQLHNTLEKLNATLDAMNSGDGTVGRLMADRELYDNLTAASAHLSSLLSDVEAHPKRYVHFSLFGQGAKAAEREYQASKSASNE